MEKSELLKKNVGFTMGNVPDNVLAQRMRKMAAMAQWGMAKDSSDEPAAYGKFSASQLYCAKCKQAMPVKERLLLYIPGGEMYDYTCVKCGSSVGSRKTK